MMSDYIERVEWSGRPQLRPITMQEASEAVDLVLEEFGIVAFLWLDDGYFMLANDGGDLIENPTDSVEGYSPFAIIESAGIIGSTPAGRWLPDSDVDVWLQVSGLTPLGYEKLGPRLTERLHEEGDSIYALGRVRKLDVHISPDQPDPEWGALQVPVE